MKKFIYSVLTICSFVGVAANLPDVNISNQEANEAMCINRVANECITTTCQTSSELDCQDNCRTAAQNKCKGAQAE